MTTLTLNTTTLDLPDSMVWVDEFSWNPVQRSSEYSVGGALLVDTGIKLAGRPITLQADESAGWIRRSTALTLQQWSWLVAPAMVLNFRSTNFNVTWAPVALPFEANQVVDYPDPLATDFMYATLRLIFR